LVEAGRTLALRRQKGGYLASFLGPHSLFIDTMMHGVYHYHKGLWVDESVAWGDHFFVEALVKAAAGRSEAGW
jgi:hypothetical protein